MPTRLKRPAFWRPLALSLALLGFQAYLGYSAINGQFGIESRKLMELDIAELKGQSTALGAEIDAYRHRAALFNPERLDPDILTERARALLNMARPGELLVMVDHQPNSGYRPQLASDKLTSLIEALPD